MNLQSYAKQTLESLRASPIAQQLDDYADSVWNDPNPIGGDLTDNFVRWSGVGDAAMLAKQTLKGLAGEEMSGSDTAFSALGVIPITKAAKLLKYGKNIPGKLLSKAKGSGTKIVDAGGAKVVDAGQKITPGPKKPKVTIAEPGAKPPQGPLQPRESRVPGFSPEIPKSQAVPKTVPRSKDSVEVVLRNGDTMGPMSIDDFRKLSGSGQIPGNAKFWSEGLGSGSQWKPVSDIAPSLQRGAQEGAETVAQEGAERVAREGAETAASGAGNRASHPRPWSRTPAPRGPQQGPLQPRNGVPGFSPDLSSRAPSPKPSAPAPARPRGILEPNAPRGGGPGASPRFLSPVESLAPKTLDNVAKEAGEESLKKTGGKFDNSLIDPPPTTPPPKGFLRKTADTVTSPFRVAKKVGLTPGNLARRGVAQTLRRGDDILDGETGPRNTPKKVPDTGGEDKDSPGSGGSGGSSGSGGSGSQLSNRERMISTDPNTQKSSLIDPSQFFNEEGEFNNAHDQGTYENLEKQAAYYNPRNRNSQNLGDLSLKNYTGSKADGTYRERKPLNRQLLDQLNRGIKSRKQLTEDTFNNKEATSAQRQAIVDRQNAAYDQRAAARNSPQGLNNNFWQTGAGADLLASGQGSADGSHLTGTQPGGPNQGRDPRSIAQPGTAGTDPFSQFSPGVQKNPFLLDDEDRRNAQAAQNNVNDPFIPIPGQFPSRTGTQTPTAAPSMSQPMPGRPVDVPSSQGSAPANLPGRQVPMMPPPAPSMQTPAPAAPAAPAVPAAPNPVPQTGASDNPNATAAQDSVNRARAEQGAPPENTVGPDYQAPDGQGSRGPLGDPGATGSRPWANKSSDYINKVEQIPQDDYDYDSGIEPYVDPRTAGPQDYRTPSQRGEEMQGPLTNQAQITKDSGGAFGKDQIDVKNWGRHGRGMPTGPKAEQMLSDPGKREDFNILKERQAEEWGVSTGDIDRYLKDNPQIGGKGERKLNRFEVQNRNFADAALLESRLPSEDVDIDEYKRITDPGQPPENDGSPFNDSVWRTPENSPYPGDAKGRAGPGWDRMEAEFRKNEQHNWENVPDQRLINNNRAVPKNLDNPEEDEEEWLRRQQYAA